MKYVIVSDIHEDYEALFKIIKNLKSTCKIICLGDTVGFSKHYDEKINRDPNKSIELLKEYVSVVLKGNHDLFHIKELPFHQVYKYPSNWFDLNAIERESINSPVWKFLDEYERPLNTNNIKFLKSLDEYCIEDKVLFSHFLFPDLTGSLILSKKRIKKLIVSHFMFMELNHCQVSFIGHLHVEFPVVISEEDREIEISTKKEIKLMKNKKYVICCPSLTVSKNGIFYNKEKSIIQLIN
ncbi:MAG: metallophosphatase family protein [Ignavibacteriae bacterium]|nr:metallophosphatase family protein [Ignavibacteriota bacterium]